MAKAVKAVGTAIMIVGAVVATGGMALAMGAGVGLLGSASLATSAVLSVGSFSVSAGALLSVGSLVSSIGGSLSQPKVSSAGGALGWVGDPNGPLHFAAGRIAVGGDLRHKAAYGPNDRMYFSAVTVVSDAGPIDAFESFTANDIPVTFDASGKANTSYYANVMWRRTQLGWQPEGSYLASPSGLQGGASLPNWGASHKLSGKAAFILTLSENSKQSAYKGQYPKPRTIIRGLLVYDWRRDSTYPGGSGPQRLNDPSTWSYSANPILWSVKWLLGLWEGPTGKGAPQVDYQVGGIGTRWENIDVAAFTEAANIADTHGWTCAAWPSTDEDKAQVLDAFLQAGGAYYIERAGKASCIHRAAPRVSVATITAADTAGPIELDTSASYLDRKNTGVATYLSEADGWKMTPLAEVSSPQWVTEDGGRKRSVPVTYSYVDKAKQAAELMCLALAHTREGISGRIPLKSYMQGIGPGSAFTITEPEFVLDGLKCLCLETSYDANTGVHTVTFVSETDAKYPYAFGQTPNPPAPPALTPVDPTHVSPPLPGDWTITPRPPAPGGGQLPGFDLGGIVSNETATAVIVEYGPTATGPWTQAYQGPPTVTNIPIDGLQPGATYFVAVQHQRDQNYSERYIYGPYTAPLLDPSPTAPTIVSIRNDIEAAFGDIFDVSELLADARTQLDAQGAEIVAARNGEATLSARIAGVNQARIDGDEANALAISGVAARTANTEADIIDLENALANETTARAEAVQQVTARQRAAPNLLPPIRAWPFFGGAWVDDNYPTLGDYTFSTAPGSFRYFDVAIEAGAPFVVSIEGASGNGSRVQVEYHGASGYIADSGIDLRAFTWGQRVEATFAAPVGLGITKARVLLQNFTTASWARAMLQPGSISTSYREDAAVSSLGAMVTEQSLAIVDLENQQAIATWRIKSEASGSKPAIIEAVSALGGAYVAFGAEQIYFGGNTVFDDATDTWQTVEGSTVYVRADGAPFGANANLREWWGPVGIALGAMTTANGYSGRMTTAPYNFDNTSGVGFHVKSSHMYISASRTGPGSVGTANVTVEAVGAVGPVDFIVYRMSGDASIEAFPVRSTASTAPYRHILSFDTNLTNQTKRAVFGCSARDAAGNTGNVVIEVEIFYNEE
ncbi:hypothetical protein [Brevundimonas diminuta]|uniref:fibronectin type III domain-containing protein n=1 Tax=Brevundimonas diminuta TaxID=293 RepID=UPI003D9A28B9